jgi:uncharacterized protein
MHEISDRLRKSMSSIPFNPATERYVSLATYKRDGSEILTPVWLAQAGKHFYIFSAGSAFKVKRIRANPHAKMAPCTATGKITGPWINVSARIAEEPELIKRGYQALRKKYGWQMGMLNFFSALSGKIKQRALIELRI